MKPIIFSTPMVQAILDGKKTQTRRVIKPQPDGEIKANIPYEFYGTKTERIFTDTKAYLAPCSVGDILWVRETWCTHEDMADVFENQLRPGYYYKANEIGKEWVNDREIVKWRPSIHMPREAARIFLRATNVRVERLQEITEEDAIAEGVGDPYDYQSPEYYDQPHMRGLEINKSAFAGLWDSLNEKRGYGWRTNPWIWVIEFEREEVNHEQF
jgi:hypothetical protein